MYREKKERETYTAVLQLGIANRVFFMMFTLHYYINDFVIRPSHVFVSIYAFKISLQIRALLIFFSSWIFQDFTEKRMDINGTVVVSYRWTENEHYVLAVKQGTLVVKVIRCTVLSIEAHC